MLSLAVAAAIDREAVVKRHRLLFNYTPDTPTQSFDTLTIGNGVFAFNVDPTGLQVRSRRGPRDPHRTHPRG